jgi:hypothetical protein
MQKGSNMMQQFFAKFFPSRKSSTGAARRSVLESLEGRRFFSIDTITAAPVTIHETEGQAFTAATVATFTDSALGTSTSDYSATIDWGDGTTSAGTIVVDPNGGFDVTGDHQFNATGTDPITVTITNTTLGGVGTASSSAQVADAALADAVGTHGRHFRRHRPAQVVLATFTDTSGAPSIGDLSATISFKRGKKDAGSMAGTIVDLGGGQFQVVATPTQLHKGGQYAFTVDIADVGGSTATATGSLKVD